MKKIILLLSFVMTTASFAASKGGGGGDPTEARVEEIRIDLVKWINDGGSKGLKLPSHLTIDTYNKKMLEVLEPNKVTVEFTDQRPSPVNINGHEKTCISFYLIQKSKILCDIEKFRLLNESEEYRLIHHEFAGLANIENNIENISDYRISNQITSFLKVEQVLRLGVKRFLKTDPIIYERALSDGQSPDREIKWKKGDWAPANGQTGSWVRPMTDIEVVNAQDAILNGIATQSPKFRDFNCKRNDPNGDYFSRSKTEYWKLKDFYLDSTSYLNLSKDQGERIKWYRSLTSTGEEGQSMMVFHLKPSSNEARIVHISIHNPQEITSITIDDVYYYEDKKINIGSISNPVYVYRSIIPARRGYSRCYRNGGISEEDY